MKSFRHSKHFLRKHSLSLAASSIVLLWIVLYVASDPSTHLGAFFGNAIADWTGVVVTVLMTKHLYEKGSAESKQPEGMLPSRVREILLEHSLTIFLVLTGVAWVVVFALMDANSRWGQVIGNVVSEWTQILGMVLITKRLIEVGSKTP
jgi:hypothetical protein